VRNRIDELEDEVEIWKIRYQEVMARLGQTEGEKEEEEREIRREADAAAAVGDAEGHSHT
jgi:lipase chaperone LimK